MKKSPRKMRALSWLPAALVVGASVMTTLGVSLIPGATASTQQVTVSATVPVEIHATNNCLNAITYGSSLLVSSNDTVLGSCRVDFGTNNATAGAVLTLANSGNGTPFFCKRTTATDPTTACVAGATNQFTDGSGADLVEGAAGGKLVTATGCTSANWTTGAASVISATATTVCTQSVVGTDGQYTFSVVADPASNQAPGDYKGRVAAVATAT